MTRHFMVATAVAAAPVLTVALTAAPGTDCASLATLTIPNVTINAARPVANGNFTPPGSQTAMMLPQFCRVEATARPTSDSEIKFEVWIPPSEAWNGKFQGVGNAGYQGSISYMAMANALRRGYATASTDTGHTGDDMKFGQGHPEKLIDYGHRAIHVMTESSKVIIRNAAGRFADKSYFVGCSAGGQQALSEAQRYPDDYDGIVAGDPASNRIRQTFGFLSSWMATHSADGGKLLMYTGWLDPVVPPQDTVAYYEGVVKTMGGLPATRDFYRLFMAPGMGHCAGGPGPNQFDALGALEQWVEKGVAPDKLIATHSANGKVDRSRPLCPYPMVARYKGTGSTDEAASFSCVADLVAPPRKSTTSSPR